MLYRFSLAPKPLFVPLVALRVGLRFRFGTGRPPCELRPFHPLYRLTLRRKVNHDVAIGNCGVGMTRKRLNG